MCFSSPKAPEVRQPVDRESAAARRAYNAAADRRASAYSESDTDVVGALIAKRGGPQVSTQLKRLMGA